MMKVINLFGGVPDDQVPWHPCNTGGVVLQVGVGELQVKSPPAIGELFGNYKNGV